ncbi:MAG: response regulator transcription factor [Chloroflexi bacterium]|nr:response regulator transcription factor [Chloroflexota bacterium]
MDIIRIMLVDDHQVIREGLRRILELEPDMKVVAEAASAQEALDMVQTFLPEVILMDIKMGGMDGVEATRRIKQTNPRCRVIMLTLYGEYLAPSLRSGADGYLLKDLRREDLVKAVREVWGGRTALNLSLPRDDLDGLVAGTSAEQLSERELAVLRLVARGVSSKEIVLHLAMSEATVKRVLHQACEKLGASNRAEAVAQATKRNLL